MSNPNLLDRGVRNKIIGEILSEENRQRKAESLKRFEIYRERQGRFILEKLEQEFSAKTVKEMRKILSINLVKRITDERASIYNNEPSRSFFEVSEREADQLQNIYDLGNITTKLKLANRYFKLFDQCLLQVLPQDGVLTIRALAPHHVDVVPDFENPEKPFAVILNILNKTDFIQSNAASGENLARPGASSTKTAEVIDGSNQSIGDPDDYRSELNRYIVWTDEFHFIMNGKGVIVNEVLPNPIGRLPFVDVSSEKDFEFWVRRGNNAADFQLEFSTLLCDVAEIHKLQGHAQAVISAEQQPQDMVIGPNHVLFLQLDPNNPQLKPTFEFVSPSPDMGASLELLETYLRLFLSANGVDPKTISGKLDSNSFSSGIERLLSLVEKFEASQSDVDLFKHVEEDKLFQLLVAWSNSLQNVIGEGALDERLRLSSINQKAFAEVMFSQPSAFQTMPEKEDSAIKLLNAGLISRSEAIAKLRQIDESEAEEILKKIDMESLPNLTVQGLAPDGEPEV